MGFFTKIEELAASKLKEIFLDSQKLVDASEDAIASLEAKLLAEKQKVADLAAKAQAAAEAAAEKAKREAEDLVDAALDAAARAAKHAAAVPTPVAPVVTADPAPVAPVVTADPAPVDLVADLSGQGVTATVTQTDPNVGPPTAQ